MIKKAIQALLRRIFGPLFFGLACLSLTGCALKLPGTIDPTVEVARIIAAAQTEAIKAITAAMSKADASACEVSR